MTNRADLILISSLGDLLNKIVAHRGLQTLVELPTQKENGDKDHIGNYNGTSIFVGSCAEKEVFFYVRVMRLLHDIMPFADASESSLIVTVNFETTQYKAYVECE